MKEAKLIEYLFASKKKKKIANETLDDKQKYDTRLLAFLSSDKLDAKLYRRILLQTPTKIIPRMANPILLADFLTTSYETQNNASKILALHGLYVLMTQYNLEYPFFFGKLYCLLTIDLFSAKYKARFFYLLDIFLQSSHLPANLVASFIKRLARLALLIPQHDQCLIIVFIYNLMIRHPTTRAMIHNEQSQGMNSTKDPYCSEERDPNKTNAIDSSLWEIESLTHHHHPDVSTSALALMALRATSTQEREIHPLLEVDYDEMFENDLNRRIRSGKKKDKSKSNECPVNFNMAASLFD